MRPPTLRFALLAVVFFVGTSVLAAAPNSAPLAGQRVLWLGDSITQAGDYVTFAEYYQLRNPQNPADPPPSR